MCILHIKKGFYCSFSLQRNLIRTFGAGSFLNSNVKSEISVQDNKPTPKLRFSDSNKNRRTIGPFGWLLLVVPLATFCLGSWQVRRKAWKEQLCADLRRRRDAQPVSLPDKLSPEQASALEYYPIHVRGRFVHDRQMFVGPRTLLIRGGAATDGSTGLMSGGGSMGASRQGYLLVTPFQLEGRKEMILVNRGWVPARYAQNPRRHTKDVADESRATSVIGLFRLAERRPPFMPQQQSSTDATLFMYRDVERMAALAGDRCAHVFLDATDDADGAAAAHQGRRGDAAAAAAPIPNQTRVSLRNEHLSYVLTWYGLSAATAVLWYRHFLVKR